MNNTYEITVFEASEHTVKNLADYINTIICECEHDGNSIFVDPSDVAKTVEAINNLGFETDEDES